MNVAQTPCPIPPPLAQLWVAHHLSVTPAARLGFVPRGRHMLPLPDLRHDQAELPGVAVDLHLSPQHEGIGLLGRCRG